MIRNPCRALVTFLIAYAYLSWSVVTVAAIRTCLEIEVDDPGERSGFEKLVRAEVATHPSHLEVDSDCQSRLMVQMFEVASSRQITVQIDHEVPVRYTISTDNMLAGRLRQAISLALGNDPTYLASDITKYSRAQRAMHDIKVVGHNMVQLELFEVAQFTGKGTVFATGGAVGYSRGARHFQVFGRISAMGRLGQESDGKPFLRVAAGVDLGVAYELSALAAVSGYFALGLSAHYMRFEGQVRGADGRTMNEKADAFVPSVFGRMGVRVFRLSNFNFDIFLTGALPLMLTKDETTDLFSNNQGKGQYTPFLTGGVGVGF